MWLEEKMWRLKIQLAQDSTEDILETLAEIISFNYENLKDSEKDDFQSIYNLHEMFLSKLTPLALSSQDSSDMSFDSLIGNLANTEEKKEEDTTQISVVQTRQNLSKVDDFFNKYANVFKGEKTVNGLNCRKSALLSQLLLRHKILVS